MANRKDVAKEANVSTTAVSYFTNGNGYLSQEKRERIAAAIKKLNYKPNPVAKSLKMKDSKQLAFLFNEFGNPYHSQLANTAMLAARKQGYTTLVANYVDDEYVLDLCSYMISGVLVCTYEVTDDAVNKIADMGIPVVVLGGIEKSYPSPLITQITFDYANAIREVLEWMDKQNKKNLCYIGTDDGKSFEQYSDIKTQVLEAICEDENYDYKFEKILVPLGAPEETSNLIKNRFSKKGDKIELFLCSNNSTALLLLSALSNLNISIPDDVEVIAFDDTIYSKTCVPKLTVVDLDANYISDMAIEYLIRKCQKEKVYNVQICPKLIYRDSTLPNK